MTKQKGKFFASPPHHKQLGGIQEILMNDWVGRQRN